MRKTFVGFFLSVVLLIGAMIFWPMEYRVFEYKRQSEIAYGFEGREWLVGEWQKMAYGADSQQEAERWIDMQSKTRGGF